MTTRFVQRHPPRSQLRRLRLALAPAITGFFLLAVVPTSGFPQEAQTVSSAASDTATPVEAPTGPAAPAKVEVNPEARDEDIRARLENILEATGWFRQPEVRVDEGVVFLSGVAEDEQYKSWAGELARNTQDVVAIVNQLEIARPSVWEIEPAVAGLRELWRDIVYSLPFAAIGLVVLAAACLAAILTSRGLRGALRSQLPVPLLREVVARAVGALVFLLGLYIVLKVSGLTRLALTVLGGTGILGLVLGIAFRDITENFLASVLLSLQRPFRAGDLVEIEGALGYVQQLNVRTTVLMTLTGNHVQIPNSTVYKSVICNYTSNPNRREDFTIGIGYDATISDAQEAALAVLAEHPAVLHDPEPWVLVDSLGPATVNLRIYFWINGSRHSWLKVKSSVIRLVKREFQERGIAMPDEAREVIFPKGVPIQMLGASSEDGEAAPRQPVQEHRPLERAKVEPEVVSTRAEAGLQTDAEQIDEQARHSRIPEQGEDLLGASATVRRR